MYYLQSETGKIGGKRIAHGRLPHPVADTGIGRIDPDIAFEPVGNLGGFGQVGHV